MKEWTKFAAVLRFVRVSLVSAAAVMIASVCNAQTEERGKGFDYGEIDGVFENPKDREGYVDFGPLDPVFTRYFEAKEALREATGISYLIEDRLINQWGEGTSVYDNELNLIGRWDFWESGTLGPASLNVWGQFAQSIGGRTVGRFQADLGVLSPLNGGNSGPDTTNEILHMLAWEQIAPGNKFRLQVGKLALRTLVNLNRYAHGDSEMFFSPMLGNNPVVPYTALLGLGAFAQWKEDEWYLSGLVRAADTELGLSTDALRDGDFEYVGEVAFTPETAGLGAGEYRVTFSYLEETAALPGVFTVSASFDQDIGERIGAFFRYAYADGTFRDFDNRAAAGFQLKEPLGFRFDRLGVGGWWGDPSDSSLNNELGLEVFYKAQVKRFLEITPDAQLIVNPARSSRNLEAVVGVRLRLAL